MEKKMSTDVEMDLKHVLACACNGCNQRRVEGEKKLNRIEEVMLNQSHRGSEAQTLATIGVDIVDMLLRKNHDYGCSAWRTPVLAPGMSPRQAIQCRMSDKISRLNTLLSGDQAQVTESIEDTMRDLAGYAILWLGAPKDSTK